MILFIAWKTKSTAKEHIKGLYILYPSGAAVGVHLTYLLPHGNSACGGDSLLCD